MNTETSEPTVGPTLVDRVLDGSARLLRRLPRGRTSLFRAARKALGNPERILGKVGRQYFCIDTRDDDVVAQVYLWDRWELPASALWAGLLRPGHVVVDAGANKGYFSLQAAGRVLPAGRVLSYEPHPGNVCDLNTTRAANGYDHWTVRPVALSSATGKKAFHAVGWSSGFSSLGSFERTGSDGTNVLDVATTTLDEDLASLGVGSVDLMKMDVEGHELAALEGAQGLLRSGRLGVLLLELHLQDLGPARVAELFGLMLGCGYRPRVLQEDAHTPAEWRAIRDGRRRLELEQAVRPIDLAAIEKMPFDSPRVRPHLLWSR